MFFERDSNSLVTKIKEIQNVQEVNYNETNYVPMFAMTDMRYFPGPKGNVKYDDDMKRFLTIKLTSKIVDYSKTPKDLQDIDIGLRPCTVDDAKTEY